MSAAPSSWSGMAVSLLIGCAESSSRSVGDMEYHRRVPLSSVSSGRSSVTQGSQPT